MSTLITSRFVQPENGPIPILFTDLGILIVVRLLQFAKALPLMLLMLSGKVIDLRLMQLPKVNPAISFIELGIVIVVRFVQLQKAYMPIYPVTVLGISTEVRLLHDSNADWPIVVTVYSLVPYLIVDGITKSPLIFVLAAFTETVLSVPYISV